MSAQDGESFVGHARARLDALLELEILRLRARYQLSLDEQRGLYISDEQVDQLVQAPSQPSADQRSTALAATIGRLTQQGAQALRDCPRWSHVVAEFALTGFELDVLLLAVAPELDLAAEELPLRNSF